MLSRTTEKFRALYESLPAPVQEKARAAYARWSNDPDHPSLRFKKVHTVLPVYSVRIDLDYRAVGILDAGVIVWFWIGSHAEYVKVLRHL